ncbi:MAG: MFS transporter [Candidatus Latescibacterota bacterium]
MVSCFYGMMTVSFTNAGHIFWLPSIAADLGLGGAASGLFLSGAFWGMVAAILVAGPLADRYGFRALLVASALCQATSLLWVSHTQTAGAAFLAVGLGSIGTGTILALATPVAFLLYPHARLRVSNLVQSFCSVGSVIVIAIGLLVSHQAWVWREAYRLTALLVVPYGVAFLLLPLPKSGSGEGVCRKSGDLLRDNSFRLLLIALFLIAFIQVGVGLWLPSYMETVVGGTRTASGVGMIFCGAAGALGMGLNSFLVERLGTRRLCVIGGAMSVVALLSIAIATDTAIVIGCFLLLMLGMSGFGPAAVAHAGDRFPAGGASMYSLLFATGNLGCAVAPLVIGSLAEAFNLRVTMALMAMGPVAAVLLLLKLFPLGGQLPVAFVHEPSMVPLESGKMEV